MTKKILLSLLIILLLVTPFIFFVDPVQRFFKPTTTSTIQGLGIEKLKYDIIADMLQIPWEIAFLPDKSMLITERPGQLLHLSQNGSKKYIEIPDVNEKGEGGLLGIAVHPHFQNNQFIYLYLTTESSDGLINRIERYKFQENSIIEKTIIIDDIPGATYHDGGALAFGPDNLLYITTGDAGDSELAQDLNSLSGKVLRLKDDGSIPEDNPFQTAVYSYGHRNSQGLAWDSQGRLWSPEHGRSGLKSGMDEINIIEIGKNYGWPEIEGDESKTNMENPILHSGADETWAPADIVFYQNNLFFTGLRGESLYQISLNENGEIAHFQAHLREDFGRLRALTLGPDNYLYLSTSNTDGRGEVQKNDDKVLRINPEQFITSTP